MDPPAPQKCGKADSTWTMHPGTWMLLLPTIMGNHIQCEDQSPDGQGVEEGDGSSKHDRLPGPTLDINITEADWTFFKATIMGQDIQAQHQAPDGQAHGQEDRRSKYNRLPRPTLDTGISEADWTFFKAHQWERYKRSLGLMGLDAKDQLWNLNVNNGVQGGNFDNCLVNNPTFNINSIPFHQRYNKISVLGNGSYGATATWLVKRHPGDDLFAMKEITCSEKDVNAGKTEVETLKKCRHKNIVAYIEDFYEDSKLLIIMEFCSGGDLAEFIRNQQELLPVDFIINWLIQITSGVCFIHKMKIIHRDLKPANIFLTDKNKIKIGDFGIAKGLDKTTTSTFVGTILYMAPEIMVGEKYNMMADMWSLGISFFEIITLKKPFEGIEFYSALSKVWH